MMIDTNSPAPYAFAVVSHGIEGVARWMAGWTARLASRLALAFGLALLMAAGVDPVRSDLEAFEKLATSLFETLSNSGFDQKMEAAKTREARVAVLNEASAQYGVARASVSNFHPTTPEVGDVSKQFIKTLDELMLGMRQMTTAVEKDDQDAMMLAVQTLMQAQISGSEAEAALKAVAQKSGYTFSSNVAKK